MKAQRPLLSLALTLLCAPLFAMPLSRGFYGGLMVSGSYIQPTNIGVEWPDFLTGNSNNAVTPFTTQAKYNFGGGGGGQLGYRFKCFRLEIEGLYLSNKLSSLNLNSTRISNDRLGGQPYVTGNSTDWLGLVNLYYDVRLSPEMGDTWSPYLGLGLGYGKVMRHASFYDSNQLAISGAQTRFSNSGGIGQIIAGVTYEMDSEMSLYLDYRYLISATSNKKVVDTLSSNARLSASTINLGLNLIIWDCAFR